MVRTRSSFPSEVETMYLWISSSSFLGMCAMDGMTGMSGRFLPGSMHQLTNCLFLFSG